MVPILGKKKNSCGHMIGLSSTSLGVKTDVGNSET